MATNIELVTYAGKTVTPLDDALIYENAVTSGIIDGCECTLSGGNTIHMEGGHGIICGRKFTVYESDTNIPLSSGGTLNGRMKVHLDLSDTGEPIQFIVESASSLPALVQQDDVNVNNGIYEFVMCTFSVSETAVTNFTQVFPEAYPESREIATYDATTAQLASTDKILVQKANGDTYSMSYSSLIDSLAATLITRSGTVTDAKHALSAVENNPNVSDTLAAKINSLNSSLVDKLSLTHCRLKYVYTDSATGGFSITFPSNSCTILFLDQYSRVVYIRATSSEVSATAILGTISPVISGRNVKLPVGGWNVGTFLVTSLNENVDNIAIVVY